MSGWAPTVGERVVYRPAGGCRSEAGEVTEIRAGGGLVMVRYGEGAAKATRVADLTPATPTATVEVVTRYGGHRHLAETGLPTRVTGWLLTLCRSTSAWTIKSWESVPDHPTLSPAQMRQLPLCEDCKTMAALL